MSAPVLNAGESPGFALVAENATNPTVISVATLVVDDAIWLTIQTELINSSTNTQSLLLEPTNLIRLLPFGDLNGSVADAITLRA